jgi:hypothetical protein
MPNQDPPAESAVFQHYCVIRGTYSPQRYYYLYAGLEWAFGLEDCLPHRANISFQLERMRRDAMWSKKITRTGALVTMLLFAGVVPAAAQTATDQTTTRDMDDGGFDEWGLLGLLGLAGLLGRKKNDRTVTDTRRV